MELLSYGVIVAGVLVFVYSLIKMQTYEIPLAKLKGSNILSNENPVEKTSRENHNVKDVAIKSKTTPNRQLAGLAREKEFWVMMKSHIAVDAEDNI